MAKSSASSSQVSAMGGVNFLITIYHQENSTWQGAIQWLDTGKKVHFRSAIEMISLIEEASSSINGNSEKFKTWNEDSKSNVS